MFTGSEAEPKLTLPSMNKQLMITINSKRREGGTVGILNLCEEKAEKNLIWLEKRREKNA